MRQKIPDIQGMPDSPHVRAVGLFIRIMRRHHACVERRIGDLEIHHSQHRVLMQLAKQEGEIPSQKELAERLGISSAAVATTLKRLEKEGYVTRGATHGDSRKNRIRLTAKGNEKVAEGCGVFEAVDRAVFDGFSKEELDVLLSLLQRIDGNLDAAGAPSEPCRGLPPRGTLHRTRKEV